MSELLHPSCAERDFAIHEHLELLPGIDRIHEVGCVAGRLATPNLSIAVLDVIDWVERILLPHAAWEETALYPELDRRAGTAWVTRLMQFEHQQIRDATTRLHRVYARLSRPHALDLVEEVRSALFGLEAILRAHVEREERFLMPLLDTEPVLARTAR
jgi:hypothetical protein